MIRTQVYFPDDIYIELKLIAATGEDKFSDLIRLGAKKVIQEKKATKKSDWKAWKSFIGCIKTDFKGKSGQDLINDYYENDVV